MTAADPVRVTHYSDILCVWAWAGHRRLEQLVETFGERVEIESRFCSVFPDARGKIEANWRDRGGYAGFGAHVREVASRFPHIAAHERLWLDIRPRSSAAAHLFVKAVELIEAEAPRRPWPERLSTRAALAMREAFFTRCRDVADWSIHPEIAAEIGVDHAEVEARIRSSEAIALLVADYDRAARDGVAASPALVMNDGRQKLIGNVGYRLIEANVQELLRAPEAGQASWC